MRLWMYMTCQVEAEFGLNGARHVGEGGCIKCASAWVDKYSEELGCCR